MAGVTIRVSQLADLPPVCVCCGEPATRTRAQEFRIQRGLEATVLVASVALGGLAWTERGVTLTLPVCDYHRRRGRRSNRTFFRGTLLSVALGVAAYIAAQFDSAAGKYLGVAAAIAFLVTMVAAMHEVDDGLGVKSLAGDAIRLRGVHRKFADALSAVDRPVPFAEPV
jgi:hypothetical protein